MYTAIVGVRHKSLWTEFTNGLVVLHYAGSVAGTHLALAGVLALEVDAGLVPGAASVLQADGDRGSAAGGADTEGLVLQHLTLLARSTLVPVARVDTPAGVAGLVAGTLVMTPALHLTVWTGEGPGLVDHQAVLALADRLVAGHRALLVTLAGEPGAGVNTLGGLSVAGLAERTVLV